MPKIKKETIKHLPQTPTLKIYKYDNSKKYQCSFYVGYTHSTSGSIQKSLRTENRQEAEKKAKEIYKNWWLENGNTTPKKERSFDKDIAQPWFKLSDFKNLELTPKYNILMECIKFAKSLDIKIDNGLDIGCAEGAYTYLFSNKFGVSNMTGLDSEPARIIRGYLAKYFFNLKNINFRTDLIENFKYDNYDFISCLSVTHHLKDPMKTMEKIMNEL